MKPLTLIDDVLSRLEALKPGAWRAETGVDPYVFGERDVPWSVFTREGRTNAPKVWAEEWVEFEPYPGEWLLSEEWQDRWWFFRPKLTLPEFLVVLCTGTYTCTLPPQGLSFLAVRGFRFTLTRISPLTPPR